MPSTFTESTTYYVQTCIVCGISFGMPKEFDRLCRQTRQTFYCPNGHNQHYVGKTEAERLKQQLEAKQSALEFTERQLTRAKQEARTAEHRRRAEKAAKTKLQKRVANGVCPCCHRHFENLQRHIETKHPEFPEIVGEEDQ